ncbi:Membrane-bound lytic murein transglycosylase D precursor [Chlamydia pneumoniae B21]|nr:LysM domain-containing protein [Chlamydia pneumoniae]ETR79672.1 Membrane-bound lytic murein transglycosylase D precursor [Chlamydia pneumoniae B21]
MSATKKLHQTQTANSENYYIVQEGDSPWTIALRNHIRLDDLLKMNDLDEYKARRLKPGDQLRIR